MIVLVGVVLPYTPLGNLLEFSPMPVSLLAVLGGLTATYLLLVQAIKSAFAWCGAWTPKCGR